VRKTWDDREPWHPEEAVTLDEALLATCVNPTFLSRDERRRGRQEREDAARGTGRLATGRAGRAGGRGTQHAIAKGRWRIDLRHACGKPRRDGRESAHLLRALRTGRDVRRERAPILLAQRAERVPAGQVAKFVVGHRNASRSFNNAVRIRVFTVPSGCSSVSAMSLCESPL